MPEETYAEFAEKIYSELRAINNRFDVLHSKIDSLSTLLTGTADELPTQGLLERTIKLEQTARHQRWWARGLAGAMVVQIVAMFRGH